MSILPVQAVNGVWVNSSTNSTAFTSPVTAGNLLIAHLVGQYGHSRQIAIRDTLGNAWIPIFHTLDSLSNEQSVAWYTFSKASGTNTVITYGSNVSLNGIALAEFSGVGGVDQITIPRSQNGGVSTPLHTITSNPVTTLYADELLISFGCIAGAGYPGGAGGSVIAPMSLLANIEWTGGPDWFGQMGYQIVSSIQTGFTAQMGINSENADIQLTTFYAGTALPLSSPPPAQTATYALTGGAYTSAIVEAGLAPSVADMWALFAFAVNGQSTHFAPDVSWTDIGDSTNGQGVFAKTVSSLAPVGATAVLDTDNQPASNILALIPTAGSPAIVQQASGATLVDGANNSGLITATFGSDVSTSNGIVAVLTVTDNLTNSLDVEPADTYGNFWYLLNFGVVQGSGGVYTGIWWCPSPVSGTKIIPFMSTGGSATSFSGGTLGVYEVSNLQAPQIPGGVDKIVTAISPIGSPAGQGTAPISVTATPVLPNEFALYLGSGYNSYTPTESVPSGFTQIIYGNPGTYGQPAYENLSAAVPVTATSVIGSSKTANWAAMLALFYTQPTLGQYTNWDPYNYTAGQNTLPNTAAGNTILLACQSAPLSSTQTIRVPPVMIQDSQNNFYTLLGIAYNPNKDSFNGYNENVVWLYICQNIPGGTVTYNVLSEYNQGPPSYISQPLNVMDNALAMEVTPVNPPPTPTVVSCTPNSGSVAGGTAITNLAGTDFIPGAAVTFGGVPATSVVRVSANQLTCVTPAHAAGAVGIVVTNPDARFGTLASGFTYMLSSPTVTGCTPNVGSVTGGTAITNLSGTGFVSGCTVTFGGVPAASVVFVNSTQLTCVTPAHADGAVSIVVTNPDTQFGTLVSGYIYTTLIPTAVAIASSANPSVFTYPVTFTIGVTDLVTSPPTVPAGTITILDGTSPPVPLVTGIPLVSGVAYYTTSSLNTGIHTITASFVPGTGFESSSGSIAQVVTPLSGLWTNASFPGRLALYCLPLVGPFTSPALGAFDPRRDMQIYADGDLLNIVSFSFDPVNNRYLIFSYDAFDLQGVIQATYHIPDPPFVSTSPPAAIPPAALIGQYSVYGA